MDVMPVARTVGRRSRCLQIARGWAVEEWAELAKFEVDESAFSVARRFCDGGRRNARALLAEGWNKSMSMNTSSKSKSKSKSKSRSRRGAVERLSVCGRRDDPPWPPLLKGGKLRATFAAGYLRSLFRKFRRASPGLTRGSIPGLTPPGYMMSPLRG